MMPARRVYEGIFLAGLLAAVYLYGMAFDDFSETALVRLSYGWVAALVFGTHGLIACEVKDTIASGHAATTREALTIRKETPNRSFPSRLASVMLWSFLLTTSVSDRRNPFLSAVLATMIWTAVLVFFFEAIFPEL